MDNLKKKKQARHSDLAAKIIIMIIVAELAGSVGSLVTFPSIGWYNTLNKPAFSPPNWVFGPVWIMLYALMGIAAGLVWHSKSKLKGSALKVYGLQLGMNIAWSLIFFGLRLLSIAFGEIIILWISILATSAVFRKISRVSSLMLLPYIAWVTFALILNYSIMVLN